MSYCFVSPPSFAPVEIPHAGTAGVSDLFCSLAEKRNWHFSHCQEALGLLLSCQATACSIWPHFCAVATTSPKHTSILPTKAFPWNCKLQLENRLQFRSISEHNIGFINDTVIVYHCPKSFQV